MVHGDQMPRQPQKSLSLDTFVKRPEPQRGIQPRDSADESLFGKFVKARHLDLVDEVEVPSRPGREFHRSASASKLVKAKPKRRPSPATSAAPSRPSSMRSMRLRSESPGPPPSPDPPRPQSLRSIKSRSRSPSVQKKDLILSPVPSPRVSTHLKLPKSPKVHNHRGNSKGKSPKSPKKAPKADLLKQGLAPALSLDDSSHTPPLPPLANSNDDDDDDHHIVINTPTTTIPNKKINHDDLPALVDDSIIREKLEGKRGSTRWNILEDSPAGHAEEKLTIVSAVEIDDQSCDWRTDPSDDVEEDDDIIDDDADEHSLVVARFRRRNSLPTDPSSVYTPSQSHGETAARNDRFAPGFNNHEMWSGGATLDTQLPPVKRSLSADASLLSDDWMSLGDTADSIVPEPPGELRGRRSDLVTTTSGIPLPNYNTETPSTIKQTGRSPMEIKMDHIPSLDTDSSSKDSSTNGLSRIPIAHKVNPSNGKNPGRKNAETAKKDNSSSEPKGSTSTGRSSDRRTTQKPRKERDALRGRKPPKIPEVIPSAQEVDMRSPSTLTSTQISVLSSSRSRQQGQGLQALRQRHATKQSPKQQKSRPLNLHVESGNDRALAMQHDDDYTIGASTITTNFSTTQRTMSDKTVSIRSLFQPNSTSPSQVPRLPQRCDEEGDFDDIVDVANGKQQQQPPQPPKRSSEEDDIINSMHLPDTEISIEDLFKGKVSLKKPLGSSDGLPSVLRRPSGDTDDVLGMIKSNHSLEKDNDEKDGSDHAEDLSLEDSGAFNNSPSQKQRPRSSLSLMNKIPRSPRSPDLKSKKPSSFHRLSGGGGTCMEPPERNRMSNSSRESNGGGGSSSHHTSTNPQPQPSKDSNASTMSKTSERTDNGVGHSAESPSENSKKVKRRSKLGLFKRVASWKGAVPLEDDP